MQNRKLLLIGIDGGTWTVLQPLLDQGYMPFLKSMCENGTSGILESTIPAITPAAWGAFQTGKNPGKTGVFDFAYWDKQRHESHFVSSVDLGTTLWDILSSRGKRTAIINVPMTYPPKPINGYMISGILTPSLESEFTWPAELKKELLEAVPQYHVADIKEAANYRLNDEPLERFVAHLVSMSENRTAAGLWLIKKQPLDVMMVHFLASDFLQHVYWHCLDPTHPLFDADKQKYIFEHFYRILDRQIERLFQAFAEKNANPLLFVLSDHGFQAHYKRFNLGNWLEQEGYSRIYQRAAHTHTPVLKKVIRFLRLGKLLSLLISDSAIKAVDERFVSRSEQFCWADSRAHSVGRSNEGFIYLLPAEADEKAKLAQEITEKLRALRDPETGRPVVEKIWLKQQIFHGEKLDRLPDLIIEPSEGFSVTGYYQYGKGLFHTVTFEEDMHIGRHHKNGIFIAAGEGIRKNQKAGARILDVAPTLLSYLQIAVPAQMDGSVQKQIFEGAFVLGVADRQDVRPGIEEKGERSPYSSQDKLEIEQRLKDLGYL